MARVKRTDTADVDVLEILEYIATDSAQQAKRLVNELERAMKMLAEYPNMGRERVELSRGLMSFPVGNYIIFYRKLTTGQGIEVARVLHGSRDVDAVFE